MALRSDQRATLEEIRARGKANLQPGDRGRLEAMYRFGGADPAERKQLRELLGLTIPRED